MLPSDDAFFLQEKFPGHSVTIEANMVCVVIPGLVLPSGLNIGQADLLIRLGMGYPDVAPDMWWFHPSIKPATGGEIACTQAVEHHLGRDWQRWSRHLQPGQWRSGIDSLESYLAIVRRELAVAADKRVA